MKFAVSAFGKVDALYHVAGGSGRSKGDGPLHEITDAGLDYTLDLNLSSIMLSNRAAVKQFMQQDIKLDLKSPLRWMLRIVSCGMRKRKNMFSIRAVAK